MAITAEARTEIITLVVGMFGAAPGSAILDQLVVAEQAGASLKQIAAAVANSAEFTSIYPINLTHAEFATQFVNNIVGNEVPAADKAAAAADLEAMLNAGASRSDVMVDAILLLNSVPEDHPVWGPGAARLHNQTEVAEYYSVTQKQSGGSLQELQNVVGSVTSDPETVEDAKQDIGGSNPGDDFDLTAGPDNFVGFAGDDVFTALTVNATGGDIDSFGSFDKLDGGAGRDTLDIYTTAANNTEFGTTSTVKNIEVVNIYNTDATAAADFGDASKFEGVEELWQHNAAVAVEELANGTLAGFANIDDKGGAVALSVAATDSATAVEVALDAVDDGNSLTVAGAALNDVTISGNVTDGADALSAVSSLAVTINGSATATDIAVDSDVAATLTLGGAGLKNVDASASSGAITYTAATAAIRTVKTGAGKDSVTIQTATTAAAGALVETGAGDDKVVVNATGTGAVTVNTGEGKDEVTLNNTNTGVTSVTTGAGDDKVIVANGIDSVKTTDTLNGGEGNDTVSIDGKVFDAEDYIMLTKVITNFEVLELTGAAATIDASKLAGYTTFELEGATSTLTKVAAGQSIIATNGVNATAAGYVAPTGAAKSGTLAGELNITAVGDGAIVANAETINLTVAATATTSGTADVTTTATLTGDAKVVNVTLTPKLDTNATLTDASDDVYDTAHFELTNDDVAGANAGLTTLTLSGNGSAEIENVDGTALVTVDASGLASKELGGDATTGLVYTTTNTAAETISLGSGLDNLTIEASTFDSTDTITGLTLVEGAVAGTLDAAKSDALAVADLLGNAVTAFTKVTVTGTDLELVLVDLAQTADDAAVFQFGGDTYIFVDGDETGDSTVPADNILNDADLLIKLTGTVDLDLLVAALA